MILKRGIKIQLLAFLVITIVGVGIVSVNYIGVGRKALGQEYTAYVDLTDSGGIFSNAEVTYRGVPVGRVGPIELTDTGIKVELKLEKGEEIPRDGTVAVVANRSAVGEQYIDLVPTKKAGPYLHEGDSYTIPADRTRLPVPTAELLRNVDALVNSVNTEHLGTVIDELHKAFAGTGDELQKILDDTDRILDTADKAWPDTKKLLDNSLTVLNTQRGQRANIRGFARNLNELSTSIRKDDKALRETIDAGPGAVAQTHKAINQLSPTLPVLLANLTTTGQIITTRQAGLRSLFILYPVTLAGTSTVMPGDGTQHMGLVLNINSPPNCTEGYEHVKKRWPQKTEPKDPPLDAGCKAPKDGQTAVRGARNFPPEALVPAPELPEGATAGAGFPAGGPSGGTEPDGGKGSEAGSNAGSEKSTGGADAESAPSGAAALNDGKLYMSYPANSVQFAGYDPTTGAVYGADGKTYAMPRTAGERELGEDSWKWLLLGPLAQ